MILFKYGFKLGKGGTDKLRYPQVKVGPVDTWCAVSRLAVRRQRAEANKMDQAKRSKSQLGMDWSHWAGAHTGFKWSLALVATVIFCLNL